MEYVSVSLTMKFVLFSTSFHFMKNCISVCLYSPVSSETSHKCIHGQGLSILFSFNFLCNTNQIYSYNGRQCSEFFIQ